MQQLVDLLSGIQPKPTTFIDIGLTALLIYGLFSLIRDTRAVRLVIGVTLLYGVYVLAQVLGLQLLSQILQATAVVGLFALVVVFQPELRRALERLGQGEHGPGGQDTVSADDHRTIVERRTGHEDGTEQLR